MPTIAEIYDQAVRYQQGGNLAQAEHLYCAILQVEPSHPGALNNLGILFSMRGQVAEGIACFRHATVTDPDHADGYYNLGYALLGQKQPAEAAECFRQAARRAPQHANPHFHLGNALVELGHVAEAAACFREAVRLNPNHAEALNNLGFALNDLWRLDEAAQCYQAAVRLSPNKAAFHNNLGITRIWQERLDEALESFREAVRLKPDYAQAHVNIGKVLKDQGQVDEALGCYQLACQIDPDRQDWHSNFLYTMLYHPRYGPAAILEALRRWNDERARPLAPVSPAFSNDASPERRLRIGYISPDFRDHILGRMILPLLQHQDHEQFDVTLYADLSKADGMTERFRACADHWRVTAGWSDERVAARVQQDGIDVLVDLTMHMAGSRLLVFARKPAPVQVTSAAYPGSTGLDTMDYRLTDPHLDPPELEGVGYTETTYWLPHSFWCFDPQDDGPPVGSLPALEQGFITFGCLNNFCKVHDGVLELWARVLVAVAGSRLLLLAKQGSHRQRTLDFFSRRGVAANRIEFCSPRPRPEYLALYHGVDMSLDTFPYNGHATSLDSYWMGVPVVSLVGNTVVGRAGLSQLANLGLAELAARSPEDFVRQATALAGDLPRLQALRSGLRDRMKQSPLMDAEGFTRATEEAYRAMWRRWCQAKGERNQE